MKALCLSVLAVLAGVLPAQVSGSINSDAPVCAQSVAMGDTKIELTYTSIRFGQGEWKGLVAAKDEHEGFNKFAEETPIGTVKTTVALSAAGRDVPAGKYSMFFTVHEKAGWILNLKPEKGEALRWRLMLKPSGEKSECLRIRLEPTAKDSACSLTIAFGDELVTVPVKVGGGEKSEKDDKKGH